MKQIIIAILLLCSLAVAQKSPKKRPAHHKAKTDTLQIHNVSSSYGPVQGISNSINLKWGIVSPIDEILDKTYFLIDYNCKWKIPYWVGYYISQENLQGNAARSNKFKPDPDLESCVRSEPSDYLRTGYDKGHNAPAADFKRSEEAMAATFLLSNMSPQTPALNRDIWKKLEDEVRQAVINEGEGWVITGNIFMNADSMLEAPMEFIGDDSVAVPTHCFKALLIHAISGQYEMYAFLLPNQPEKIPGTPSQYMLTVDRLEKIIGYDFYPELPDSIEIPLENTLGTWPR